MDPITLSASAIASLAFNKILEKSVDKFTEAALAKMDELRRKIGDKLRGDLRAEKAFAAVEQGSKPDLDRLAVYLHDEMDEDQQFASEIQALAQEIHAGKLQDNSSMTQNNSDNAKGWQTKVEGGTAYFGEIHINQKPN